MKPFINIVIPTRERAEPLYWAIKSCLLQDYSNYKIVISDNDSMDNTAEIVHAFSDSRIEYIKTSRRLSMSENWEFALKHVDEGYVIYLGDDDGLVPNVLTIVAGLIEQTGSLAIRSPNIVYYWPNIIDKNIAGMIYNIPLRNDFEWINSKKFLNAISENLEYYHPYFLDLPTVYQAFVNVDLVKRIVNRDGGLFLSAYPDMYSAVIVAAETDKYILSHQPASINAMSRFSNGIANNNFLEKESVEVKRFFSENTFQFDKMFVIPGTEIQKFHSHAIVIADQLIKAREKNKNVPDIDIKNVVKCAVYGASKRSKKEQFDVAIEDIRRVAKINCLEDFAEELISKVSFNEIKHSRCELSVDENNKICSIDTLNYKVNNVFEAGLLVENLFKQPEVRKIIYNGKKLPAHTSSIEVDNSFREVIKGRDSQTELKEQQKYFDKENVYRFSDINNISLAIFTPNFGTLSETFIKKHIDFLFPGKTAVVTGNVFDRNWTNVPVLQIPYTEGPSKYSPEIEEKVESFLKLHNVTHILVEYGCYGTEIVELNQRKLKLPIFIHFHGGDASAMLKRKEMVEYYNWMGNNVTGIITVAKPMAERLINIGIPHEKVIINHYGIDIPEFIETQSEKSPCHFIFVGRLTPKKAPDITLKAFAKAYSKVKNIHLDIVGDHFLLNQSTSAKAQLEDYVAKNNLQDAVTFHGAQPNEYVKKILSRSSVYVQHSVTVPETGDAEGLPNSILEASAYGLPVISTFHEGIPEEVENYKTGFLVNEFDVDTMAKYMIKLANDPALRKSMGLEGKKKIEKEFSKERSIEGLRRIISSLPEIDKKKQKIKEIQDYISNGNLKEAEELCHIILGTDTEFVAAHFLLGEINYASGNYEQALGNFTSAFQFSNQHIDAAVKVILSNLMLERLDDAVRFLKKVIIVNPYEEKLLLLAEKLKIELKWEDIWDFSTIRLYAGDIPEKEEYEGLIGLSIEKTDFRHIRHDITNPFPLDDNSVDSFQAEDVFEHIASEKLPAVFNEIYRVLKPGATFRLSIPDYGCDVLIERSVKDTNGTIIFDPGGGGTIENPGHLWYPVYSNVEQLLQKTEFAKSGIIDFLHYYNSDGTFVLKNLDYSRGFVMRNPDHDNRVQNPRRPISIIVDLIKAESEYPDKNWIVNSNSQHKRDNKLQENESDDLFNKNIPIILICYNRPRHTRQVLESLKRHDIKNLYIFSDAPKSGKDIVVVNEVRNLIGAVDWIIPNVYYQEENKGLAKSITDAVNLVFEKYDKLILLEDDCVPQKYFFEFMYTCLNKYENNEKIFGISGYTVPIPNEILNNYPYDIYFSPRIGSWGWGTWRRAWVKKINNLDYLKNELTLRNINVNQGGDDVPGMFEKLRNGNLKDVWTINWLLTVYLNKGFYIYPTESHIINIGLDGSGVHCGKTDRFNTFTAVNKPGKYPSGVELSGQILQYFIKKHNEPRQNVEARTSDDAHLNTKERLNALEVYNKIFKEDTFYFGEFNKLLNLGCGSKYHNDWVNVDMVSMNNGVIQHNLEEPLPFDENSFDVVYHSHVLEHFSRNVAFKFIRECHRVLRNGGIIRVVVPDLEQIAKHYLSIFERSLAGDLEAQAKYDWIILEMFDQMVRNYSGGEMLKYWQQEKMPAEEFVLERMGSEVRNIINSVKRKTGFINMNSAELDAETIGKFRLSGEIHQWMYDKYSLGKLLKETGFKNIKVCNSFESSIPDFNKYHLDVEEDNSIRKPDSLFMEAIK
jgi:glycosyltransferase involved in cell wall biosynthesis/predicted SAM-dependent methyltransferase